MSISIEGGPTLRRPLLLLDWHAAARAHEALGDAATAAVRRVRAPFGVPRWQLAFHVFLGPLRVRNEVCWEYPCSKKQIVDQFMRNGVALDSPILRLVYHDI